MLPVDSIREAYDELYVYTMEHARGSPSFILQHVVDAFAAQTAAADDKAIRVVFALIGLYLHLEKQYTGRQVQLLHMQLGKQKRDWPRLPLPEDRGAMTAAEVLAAAPGPDRDRAIDAWCESVWTAFRGTRQQIIDLLREHSILSEG